MRGPEQQKPVWVDHLSGTRTDSCPTPQTLLKKVNKVELSARKKIKTTQTLRAPVPNSNLVQKLKLSWGQGDSRHRQGKCVKVGRGQLTNYLNPQTKNSSILTTRLADQGPSQTPGETPLSTLAYGNIFPSISSPFDFRIYTHTLSLILAC